MQRYLYTARDEKGKIVKGTMIAENEIELAEKISRLGYFLTNYKAYEDTTLDKKLPKMKAKEVLSFTLQLVTLIDAGLPLLEALNSLAKEAENERVQRLIDDIRYRVEGGSSFREALSFHPSTFSNLYVSIVGAGEATGRLSQVLNDLARHLEWQQELRTKIKEASTYPIILFFVMIGVVALLTVFVIPKFEPIFEQSGAQLPLPTKIILGISHFVKSFWWVILILVGAVVLGYRFYNSTERGRYNLDSFKLKLPIFGQLLRKIVLSRFTHTFSMCVRSGINLLAVLDIAKETVRNRRIEKAIEKIKESVKVGEKLATSLRITGEFPSIVVRMVAVGEQSGALSGTLEKVASFYDKEVASSMKRIFALLEPIMIVIMGVVVGGIALSMFMPLFKMVQFIGG
jgi:type II secretory pathway component PulF